MHSMTFLRGNMMRELSESPCQPLSSMGDNPLLYGVLTTAVIADIALFVAYSMISAFLVYIRFKHKEMVKVSGSLYLSLLG